MNVDQLNAKYGGVLAQEPFLSCEAAHQLYNQFKEKCARIDIGVQPFKTWISRYRLPLGATRVSSAVELEEKHVRRMQVFSGDVITWRGWWFDLRVALGQVNLDLPGVI